MLKYSIVLVILAAVTLGCSPAQNAKPSSGEKKKGIIGKTTQEIGKFDANAGHAIEDGSMDEATPGLASLQAYGPAVQKMAKIAVKQRVDMYNALHGKFPNYDEFMNQIVKDPQSPLKLPVLPGKKKYYYDETNHTLVVVDPNPDGDK